MATTPSNVPREPSAYSPGNRFGQLYKGLTGNDPDPHLDGDIVAGCLLEGDTRETSDGIWHFEHEFAGVRYRLVVDLPDREIVAGYPVAIDEAAVAGTSRWSERALADIRARLDQ